MNSPGKQAETDEDDNEEVPYTHIIYSISDLKKLSATHAIIRSDVYCSSLDNYTEVEV